MGKLEKWIFNACQIIATILPKKAKSLRQPTNYFEKAITASVGLIIR